MAKKKGDAPDDNSNERLHTSPEDRIKADKWFQRAKELGGKRQRSLPVITRDERGHRR